MNKFFEFINKAEMYMTAVFLVSATTITFVAAMTRVLNYPINWAIDVSLFLWAWCIFFGGDIALRNDKLVSFDLVPNKLSPKVKRIHATFLYLIILVFLVALLIYGSRLAYTTRVRPFQSIPSVSYTWVTLSLPIGALLMIRTVIIKIIALFKKKPPVEEKKEEDFEHTGEIL